MRYKDANVTRRREAKELERKKEHERQREQTRQELERRREEELAAYYRQRQKEGIAEYILAGLGAHILLLIDIIPARP